MRIGHVYKCTVQKITDCVTVARKINVIKTNRMLSYLQLVPVKQYEEFDDSLFS